MPFVEDVKDEMSVQTSIKANGKTYGLAISKKDFQDKKLAPDLIKILTKSFERKLLELHKKMTE